MLTRRMTLGALATPAVWRQLNAQGLRPTSFSLSWLADGYSGYAYVAKARGYWRERGLDVSITRGHGSVTAAQALAAGHFEFGLSNATVVLLLAAKGLYLRALSMISYETSMGVAFAADAPIHSPADLIGKKVGQAVSSSDAAFFKPWLEQNKVDADGVQILAMDPQVRDKALLSGTVDAVTGFASSYLAALLAAGKPVRQLLYSHTGMPIYGDATLLTQEVMAAKEPSLCQAVADGLMAGVRACLLEPDAALAEFTSQIPELKLTANGTEFARLGMAVQRFNVLAGEIARTAGLGVTDTVKLADTTALVLRYQAEPGTAMPDISRIFPNTHAGAIKLSAAEWAKAEANTAFLNQAMGA